ncbi:MAG: asparagine synthase C-terminal domain-containing protein, partial [bacterium]|nr:asparagine synthase C-terminal domain-containing protein [bacterium]
GEETLFEGIFSLLPAQYLIYRKGTLRKKIYWNLPFPKHKKNFDEDEVLQRTKKLLQDSIKLRLRSDVPVGAFLSGGLDSSLIIALMAEAGAKNIKTFSAGFEKDEFNELPHAKRVSKLFGTDHHDFVLTEKEYAETLGDTIRAKDAPLLSPNEVAWFLLSKKMKKDITVALAGGGADELFGGYGRIFRSGYDFERLRSLKKNKFTLDEKREFLENIERKYGTIVFKNTTEHFLVQYPYAEIVKKDGFLNHDIITEYRADRLNRSFFASFFKPIEHLHPTDQYLRFFETVHLRGTMESLDSMTMSASVEGREPYLDTPLVEYVASLPFEYKLRWKSEADKRKAQTFNVDQISDVHDSTKYLLRQIGLEFLPRDIVNRKKMGFPVPLQNWFSGSIKRYAQEMLLGQNSLSSSLYHREKLEQLLSRENISSALGRDIWALLNFEIWTREYNVVV